MKFQPFRTINNSPGAIDVPMTTGSVSSSLDNPKMNSLSVHLDEPLLRSNLKQSASANFGQSVMEQRIMNEFDQR